jgi:hypothetical protein
LGLELLREAALASLLSFCMMDTLTGDLLDPLSGQAWVPWGDRSGWRDKVLTSGPTRLEARQGTAVQATVTLVIGAGLDLGACCLVPVLQVSDNQASTYGGAASLNADGLNHLMSLGANCLGFEDLLGGGDNDFNDLILRVNSLELSRLPLT